MGSCFRGRVVFAEQMRHRRSLEWALVQDPIASGTAGSGARPLARRLRFGGVAVSSTSFAAHVGHVLRLGAEEQVVGIAASRLVAPVQNLHAPGNGAIGQLPSPAMWPDREFALSTLPSSGPQI